MLFVSLESSGFAPAAWTACLEVDRVGRAIVAERPPDEDQDAPKVDLDAAEATRGAVRMRGSICRSLATKLSRPVVHVVKSNFGIVRQHCSPLRC
jgi:hypothetical protein